MGRPHDSSGFELSKSKNVTSAKEKVKEWRTKWRAHFAKFYYMVTPLPSEESSKCYIKTVAHTTAARESERGCIECLCQAREYSLGTKLTRTWSLSPRPISSERHPRHRRGPWPSSPREMNSVHISEMIQVSTVYFE